MGLPFLGSTRRASEINQITRRLDTRCRANLVSRSHTSSTNIAVEATVSANLLVRSARHVSGDGNGDAAARSLPNTPECACLFAVAARTIVCFRAVRAITRGGPEHCIVTDARGDVDGMTLPCGTRIDRPSSAKRPDSGTYDASGRR